MSHSFTIKDLPSERAATESLLNVIDALTLEPDFERFFQRAADAARRLVGGDGAALILLNAAGRFEYQFLWVEKVAGQIAVACHIRNLERRLEAASGRERRWHSPTVATPRRRQQPAA